MSTLDSIPHSTHSKNSSTDDTTSPIQRPDEDHTAVLPSLKDVTTPVVRHTPSTGNNGAFTPEASGANTPATHTAASSRRTSAELLRPGEDGQANVPESASPPTMQARPAELPSALSEILFVLVCSSSQLLFAIFLGDITVLQSLLKGIIHIEDSQTPWLQGAFMLANGLSVIVTGSLADLVRPKLMVNISFAWLVVWNLLGGVSLLKEMKILFFVVRAMQGLAIGVLVSTTISMLGRTYTPGKRKNRAFSVMASTAPLGFWIGALQGGALSHVPSWIFWSNAMVCALVLAASVKYLPALEPAAAGNNSEDRPSIKSFDFPGAALGLLGAGCLLFGLTQGTPADWAPYTIVTVVLGVVFLGAFGYVETRVKRPLVPTTLWRTPGFAALAISYALGFGSYIAWQFYAIRFFLEIQDASPLTTSLYLLPNAIIGVLAAAAVSRTVHILPVHGLLIAAMIAFALGPVFFLPQTANTTYWALSMPGITLVTFGPDLSFAAASIFITSAVPRNHQGAAGSLLVTIQNFSAAILTSISDALGANVKNSDGSELGLESLRAIWWFNFAVSLLGAGICLLFVRIPKTAEKEHVS